MTDRIVSPDWWFWLVAACLFVWGLAYAGLSLFSFVFADSRDWAAMIREGRILPEYVDYISRIPGWVIGLTFLAAATRLGGALGLLLCARWSVWAYGLSLCCVVIIMFRGFVLADVLSVIRTSQVWVEALFMALSIFAFWFALRMSRAGVLT